MNIFSYEGSVAITINKIDLPSGDKNVTTIFIASNGSNGTVISYIACLNKIYKGTSDVVYVYAQGNTLTLLDII